MKFIGIDIWLLNILSFYTRNISFMTRIKESKFL